MSSLSSATKLAVVLISIAGILIFVLYPEQVPHPMSAVDRSLAQPSNRFQTVCSFGMLKFMNGAGFWEYKIDRVNNKVEVCDSSKQN